MRSVFNKCLSVPRRDGTLLSLSGGTCRPSSGPINPVPAQASSETEPVSTDYAYEVSACRVRVGKGATREVGKDFLNRGVSRVLLLTDKNLLRQLSVSAAQDSLRTEGVEYDVFSEVRVEPTEKSFKEAIHRAQRGQYQGFLAVGGGSVMDTAKAARLFDVYRDKQLLDFVPAPVGAGEIISRQLKPLICIPTTSGTGSEVSGSAVFDFIPGNVKMSISSRAMCPTLALVDPLNTFSMPTNVAIYSGFDLLCQALEAYTAMPYTMRPPAPEDPSARPLDQGSSPMTDVAVVQALVLINRYFIRSVEYSDDTEAKSQMSLATVIKGIGFSSAGAHLCQALSYAISSMETDFIAEGYPKDRPFIPHGLSVIITAPAVFYELGYAMPERCIELARLIGAKTGGVKLSDAGRCLSEQLCKYMRYLGIPNGLSALGFSEEDFPTLIERTLPQKRLTDLSPMPVCESLLEGILKKSLTIYD